MSDPLTFDSATPRYALPLIFAGQAQKEFYVNEAHALTDALLHGAIEGIADTPPATPADGACWLVGPAPGGDWADHAGELACRQLGNWLFVAPRDGLSMLNRADGQIMRYRGGWVAPAAPAEPVGGATVDSEMRTAFAALLAALTAAGIFPAP
ncbi:MAG: DUF2793 domain-containing protein [Novosphingobium sp.]